METDIVVREWGRSLGLVIPKDVAKKDKLKAGDKVKVIIVRKTNIFAETFGKLKQWKKPTEQIMNEIDQDFWGE